MGHDVPILTGVISFDPAAEPAPAMETEWDQKETQSYQKDTYQRYRLTTEGPGHVTGVGTDCHGRAFCKGK